MMIYMMMIMIIMGLRMQVFLEIHQQKDHWFYFRLLLDECCIFPKQNSQEENEEEDMILSPFWLKTSLV